MSNISAVVIMTVPERRMEAESLRQLLIAQDPPPVHITEDPEHKGVLFNLNQALALPPEGDGWRLVLQDDVLVPRGGLAKIDYILRFVPRAMILSPYAPSNKAYDEARKRGHVARTRTNVWGQALAFPETLIPKIRQFVADRVVPGYRYDDRAIAAFAMSTHRDMLTLTTSLVQHLGAFRSTQGFPGVCGGRPRYSDAFDPLFDVEAVDWEREITRAPFITSHVDLRKVLR